MKLLHIDSSIQGGSSVSRAISAAVVDRLTSENAGLVVKYRDLAATPLPHLTFDAFISTAPNEVLEEFLSADIVVIGAALYNFTIPSQLKAWFDRILVPGKTFSYSSAGPEGLVGDKRIIVALARGGIYGADTPMAAFEHGESLLRNQLAFIGVIEPEFIIAEGVALGEEARKASLDAALLQARQLA